MSEAFRLLDSGFSRKEVAEKLGTTIRTVHRWVKDGGYQPAHKKVQQTVVQTIVKSVENIPDLPFVDVENFIESQKMFAVSSGKIAAKFLPIIDAAISRLNPDDITSRTLSSLIKSYIELTENSSTCYTRATGLEEVLNAIQIHQNLE